MKREAVLFIVNDVSFFISHRLPVALAVQAEGGDVHVAAAASELEVILKEHGFKFYPLPLSRSGTSVLKELIALRSMYKLMREIRPSLVHLVTVKPVLYGGVAAKLARVPAVVSAVSGLGAVFVARGRGALVLRAFVEAFYKIALSHKNMKVIFQNTNDQRRLIRVGAITEDKCSLIRGSGVDLNSYSYTSEPSGPVVVVMASRLLRDKGVFEFNEAAKICKDKHIDAIFRLVGDIDPGNPASLTEKDVLALKVDGCVELAGYSKDISQEYARSHVVCLPSYREGLPKSLVEAAACGRAVVTTDVPGCRDAIECGETGILVPVRDARAIAEAVIFLVAFEGERKKMGVSGRVLAEREFSIEKIVSQHMEVYQSLGYGN